MKTYETEKHNTPKGATHYQDEAEYNNFAWCKGVGSGEFMVKMLDDEDWDIEQESLYINYIKPIPQTKEVEWVNGDECLYMNSNTIHTVIGRDDKYKDSFWCKSSCGNINLLDAACLSKPETKEEQEKREREENGQSLYELVQNLWCSVDSKYTAHPYDSPMVDSKTKEMYSMLAVAVEYRKGGK